MSDTEFMFAVLGFVVGAPAGWATNTLVYWLRNRRQGKAPDG